MESPRWLLTVRKTKQAKEILLKIAQFNNATEKLEEEIDFEGSLEYLSEKLSSGNKGVMQVFYLFSKPRLAMNTILVSASW